MLCMSYPPKEQVETVTFLTTDCNGVPIPDSKSHSIIPNFIGAAYYVEFPRLGLAIRGSRF